MYVITGVTGHTGKVTAEALIARGERVRVVVRDAAKGAAWRERGVEVAVADLGDPAALTEAFRGARGVYALIPPNFAAADFRAYQRATAESIARALEGAAVPHVVLLSSVGAELPDGTGPIAGLHDAEQRLARLPGTVATFLRAGWFLENLGGSLGALAHGALPTFFPADFPIDAIVTEDIGRLAAALLVEGGRATSVVELGGPGVSHEDIAEAIGRVTGKRPHVVSSPPEGMAEALVGFGVPRQMGALYQEMTLALIAGRIRFGEGARRFTRQTSLDDALRGLLAG